MDYGDDGDDAMDVDNDAPSSSAAVSHTGRVTRSMRANEARSDN